MTQARNQKNIGNDRLEARKRLDLGISLDLVLTKISYILELNKNMADLAPVKSVILHSPYTKSIARVDLRGL